MYKKKEEKLTIAKINQTCNDMKQDLIESISYENSRANVDNAKKRAVAQRRQYSKVAFISNNSFFSRYGL